MCSCQLCKQSRRINMVIKNGSHQQKNRLIKELAEGMWRAEEELSYENCIKNGSWPTAMEILTKRLKKATQIRAEEFVLTKFES